MNTACPLRPMATLSAEALQKCKVTHAIKLVMLGSSGVGKTSYTTMCRNPATPFEAVEGTMATIGLDFSVRYVRHPLNDGEAIRLTTWDTAGQERFDALVRAYFREAQGVILMYDVTQERTFHDIRNRWLPLLMDVRTPSTEDDDAADASDDASDTGADGQALEAILIGNKTDLLSGPNAKPRAIDYETANAYATTQLRVPYVECSCKTGTYDDRVAPIQWLITLIMENRRLSEQTRLPAEDQHKHLLATSAESLRVVGAQSTTADHERRANGPGCCS